MLVWIIATVCAYFVKGLCGFANTLVFTSILSFTNNNINITPVDLLLGYPANIILVIKERKSLKWNICIPLAVLVILGSIPGALFLKNIDSGIVKSIFGIVIIFTGLEMLFREFQTKKIKQSKILMGIIGILSGLLCGMYGIGALLGAYISRAVDDSSSFKANISFVFLVDNTFRFILYSIWGILTLDVLKQTAILIPFVILGLILGIFSTRFMNDKIAKRLVIVLLIISGITLLVNNI